MFNTGTIVGIASNIFGAGYPPKYVPSFSWGGASGFELHRLEDAIQTARRVVARRNTSLLREDEEILRHVFELSEMNR